MVEPIATLITTISLNFLKKLGVQQSVVFSSVLVFSSLTSYSMDYDEQLPADLINGAPDFEMEGVAEQLEKMMDGVRVKNITSPIWRYPLPVHQLKHFHFSNLNFKPMRFISMNKKQNWQVSCDQEENKWAEDDEFKVLEVPLCEESLSFVVFLPKRHDELLEKSLERLTPLRFESLIHDLSPGYIQFKLPVFKIHSNIPTSRLLGFHRRPFHNRMKFKIANQSAQNSQEECRVIRRSARGMIKRPCESIPMIFNANRPFFFSIMHRGMPVTMGAFTGEEN